MDESVVHYLSEKVGGRFQLTALVQRRLIELNRGARPLVDDQQTNLRTVIEELMQGKLDDRAAEFDIMEGGSMLGGPLEIETPEQ